MPLLTFPPSPTNGQLYPVIPAINQNQYQWSAADITWVLLGSGTGVVAGTYGDAFNVPQFTVDSVGRISFAQDVPIDFSILDLQQVTDYGAVTTNVIDVAGIIAASLTYPTSDGAAGDYITTDGAGNLSWATLPSTLSLVSTVPTSSSDPGSFGQVAITTGVFFFHDGTQWLATPGFTF